MDFYDYYNPYELTHWGIKGMKWGVRRFQNKDGSLTIDGGKRYNGSDYQPRKSLGERISDYKKASKRKAALKKARATKEANRKAAEEAKAAAEQRKKDIESGKIKPKDMTNEELNDRINRLNNEKRLKQLQDETASPMETVAKQAVSKLWKEAIMPAATEAGKQILKDSILKAAKGNEKVEEFNLEKTWKNINKLTTQQVMDVNKRLTAQDAIKKKMDDINAAKEAEKQAKEDAKAEKEAKKQAMKDYEAFQKNERKSRENPSPAPESTSYNTRDNKTEYHNRRDYVDPSKEPRAEYPPAVVNSVISNWSNKSIDSTEISTAANKGERVAVDVINNKGDTIVSFDENGKRK